MTHAPPPRRIDRMPLWGALAALCFGCGGGGGEPPTAVPQTARRLAAGDAHTCVIRRDGAVLCWGVNHRGQLGDGTRIDRSTPTVVRGLVDVVQLAASTCTTCALHRDGRVSCWGVLRGTGFDEGSEQSTTPVEMRELRDVVDLRAAHDRISALHRDKTLSSWPELNTNGPTRVEAPVGVARVAMGPYTRCVVLESGQVLCDGPHYHWERPGLYARSGPALGGVRELWVGKYGRTALTLQGAYSAANGSLLCVRRVDGAVVCEAARRPFGAFRTVETALGDGGRLGIELPELRDAVDLSFSSTSMCALLPDATLRCSDDDATTPRYAGGATGAPLRGVIELAHGTRHGCALHADDSVTCWGAHNLNQLGGGVPRFRAVPTAVPGLRGVTALSRGVAEHTCALRGDGNLGCWGLNSRAELGAGHLRPIQGVHDVTGTGDVVAVETGPSETCVIDRGATVRCWRGSEYASVQPTAATPTFTRDGASRIAHTWRSKFILTTRGQLYGLSELLDPPSGGVPLADGIADIGGAPGYLFARRTNGAVLRWQVYTANTSLGVPIPLGELDLVIAELSVGERMACVRVDDGAVRCWGEPAASLPAQPNTLIAPSMAGVEGPPSPVVLPAPAAQISVGGAHACALLRDGTVACWGDNTYGQLGDGTTRSRSAPAVVPALRDVSEVRAARRHTCARLRTGEVRCWGHAADDALGTAVPSRATFSLAAF